MSKKGYQSAKGKGNNQSKKKEGDFSEQVSTPLIAHYIANIKRCTYHIT